jgi:type IV pilus assembly protein PilA
MIETTCTQRSGARRLRRAAGFTLIELLIVVVIIGVLAAIAIPKFASTKEKAYLASMKSDLRNLAVSQDAYLADNSGYSDDKVALNFRETSGVTADIQVQTDPIGWSATTEHVGTTKTCAIFVRTAAVAPATTEGQVKCDP